MTQQNEMSARALTMTELENVNGGRPRPFARALTMTELENVNGGRPRPFFRHNVRRTSKK